MSICSLCWKNTHSLFCPVLQENREREVAETRKRQQREREKLTRTAKRRSTGTCSIQDGSNEASALESVLTSFLSQRPSRRRPVGYTPVTDSPIKNIRPQVEEHEGGGDLDIPAETNEEKLEISRGQEPEDICQKEAPPCTVNDVQRARAASKRGQCIDDELIPESKDLKVGCSNTSTKKEFVVTEDGAMDKGEVEETGHMDKGEREENNDKKEEADKMPELSGKIFRFQDCSDLNGTITPDRSRGHGVRTSTPQQRNMKEVDLALQNGMGGLGSPWTILSPRISPRNTPHRRHSFSISRVDILDDGVWALPDTPVRDKPSFSCKSGVGTSSSLPDCPSKRTPAHGMSIRSASLTDEKEQASNFKLGQIFQRRNGQELLPDKRPESSGLVSFFRRFGERNRAGTVG